MAKELVLSDNPQEIEKQLRNMGRLERHEVIRQAKATLARTDFPMYCRFVHNWELAPHQLEWSELLLSHKKIAIVAPPEAGKSRITRTWLEWMIGNNKNSATLLIQNTGDQAKGQVAAVGEVIKTSEEYHMVFPDLKPTEKWSGQKIFVQRDTFRTEATLGGFGIDGAYQGAHVDTIIVDDPTDQKDVLALAIDTPIPTPSGWTNMGDIKVGDEVFDELGQPTRVVAITPIRNELVYKVSFDDNTSIHASGSHLWRTSTIDERRPWKFNGDYTPIPYTTWERSNLRTTKELQTALLRGRSKRLNQKIWLTAPLELPDKELLIDPYILGLWLGDGASSCGQFTSSDEELIEAYTAAGYRAHRVGKRQYDYGTRGLKARLQKIGVLNNKHIPDEYLRGSVGQRLALVQGLMDTDGSIERSGRATFTNSNISLISGVNELLVSLGIKTQVRQKKCYSKGLIHQTKPHYEIRYRSSLPTFRLSRKLERISSDIDARQQKGRLITSIAEDGTSDVRCITVAAKSGMYLAGVSMVPTHNSPVVMQLQKELFKGVMWDRLHADGDMKIILTRWDDNDLVPTIEELGIPIFVYPVMRDDAPYPWGSNLLFPTSPQYGTIEQIKSLELKKRDLFKLTYMCSTSGAVRGERVFPQLQDAKHFIQEVPKETRFVKHALGVDWGTTVAHKSAMVLASEREDGKIVLRAAWTSPKGSSAEMLDVVADWKPKYGFRNAWIDPQQASLVDTFKYQAGINAFKGNRWVEIRIGCLLTLIAQENLIVDKDMPGLNELWNQLTSYARDESGRIIEKADDLVDACLYALAALEDPNRQGVGPEVEIKDPSKKEMNNDPYRDYFNPNEGFGDGDTSSFQKAMKRYGNLV